jgi:molecular chaperone DnaK (HSP70)
MKTPAIGIDFGSSQLSAAVCQDGRVDIFADENGSKKVPSFVGFTEEGVLIGAAAESQVIIK